MTQWLRICLPVQGTQVQSLGWKYPLEKEIATYPRILAWEIPWTEESGGLPSTGSQRVRHDGATNTHTCMLLITQLKKECDLLRRHKDVYSDSFTDALLLCHASFLSLRFFVFH